MEQVIPETQSTFSPLHHPLAHYVLELISRLDQVIPIWYSVTGVVDSHNRMIRHPQMLPSTIKQQAKPCKFYKLPETQTAMASKPFLLVVIPYTVLLSSTLSSANPGFGFGWGGSWGWPGSGAPATGSGWNGPGNGGAPAAGSGWNGPGNGGAPAAGSGPNGPGKGSAPAAGTGSTGPGNGGAPAAGTGSNGPGNGGAPAAGTGSNGPGNGGIPASGGVSSQSSYTLSRHYYEGTCPQVYDIVLSVLEKAIAAEARVAASLLRLHFHDCFVQGCDASVLLDDATNIVSEKNAGPNKNSLRGFDVIDDIKAKLEQTCPHIVSCADIVALAARGATFLSGGPVWELPLGRKDSLTANMNAANTLIPAPNSTLQTLISKFSQQGLDEQDLVALSGGHTIGMARCATFKQRLYNQNNNNLPDKTLESSYYQNLKTICPPKGGDNNVTPLDFASPANFDNTYYKLILYGRGLLSSDEVLYTGNVGSTMQLVQSYAKDTDLFFSHFAASMIKMGSISPLLGNDGEVRLNCRRVN